MSNQLIGCFGCNRRLDYRGVGHKRKTGHRDEFGRAFVQYRIECIRLYVVEYVDNVMKPGLLRDVVVVTV